MLRFGLKKEGRKKNTTNTNGIKQDSEKLRRK